MSDFKDSGRKKFAEPARAMASIFRVMAAVAYGASRHGLRQSIKVRRLRRNLDPSNSDEHILPTSWHETIVEKQISKTLLPTSEAHERAHLLLNDVLTEHKHLYEKFIKSELETSISRRILRERADAIFSTFLFLGVISAFCCCLSWFLIGGVNWWIIAPSSIYIAALIADSCLLKLRIDSGVYGDTEFEAREVAAFILADDLGSDGDSDGTRKRARILDEPRRRTSRAPLHPGAQEV